MGHIQWSPLAVDKAMDQVREDLEPIFVHLDQAYQTASEALKQPNLPQYMKQSLAGLKYEIDRIRREKRGTTPGSYAHRGSLLDAIERVRGDLPAENLKQEKDAARHGKPLTMEMGE